MTTTRIYRSTDSGAPTLNGTAGSLIDVLHACLVGSSGIAYAGKPAAGWSEPFTITPTKAVFRNSIASGGSGCYVRVLDDGSTTGPPSGAANQEAYIKTYASMTGIDTGADESEQFIIRKSNASGSASRAWTVIADGYTFYLLVGATNGSFGAISVQDGVYFGGDIESCVPGDAFAFGCSGRLYSSTNACAGLLLNSGSFTENSVLGISLCRKYSAAPGKQKASMHYPWGNVGGASAPFANPSVGNDKQFWVPALVCESGIIRGRLRGVYMPLNNMTAVNNGTDLSALSGFPSGSNIVLCGGGNGNLTTTTGAVGIESNLQW